MLRIGIATWVALVVAPLGARAAPPPALLGKSVVVRWNETRQQRFVGELSFRTVSASHNLSAYISTAGRVFIRQTNMVDGVSGKIEQVFGERPSEPFPARVANFTGHLMTIVVPTFGEARLITAEFDATFESRGLKIISGKETGHATSRTFSAITKRWVEIASLAIPATPEHGAPERPAAGKLRALATASHTRIGPLPEVPTVAQSGYEDYEADIWYGVVAPAKTPNETVSQLAGWFTAALQAPEIKPKLVVQGLYPVGTCGADFGALIRKQYDLYGHVIRETNIKAE
jgi:hypothetical protein